jgi:hypothetical protein
MKLTKKMIDRLESSIKKIIDGYEPFEYIIDDDDLKFIKIEPYILWNRFVKNYTINLFYNFNKYITYEGKKSAIKHGYELIQRIKMILPVLSDAIGDVHVKTKEEYKRYEDELIPQVRKFLPEQKMIIKEEKYTEEYFQKMENRINKFLSKFKPLKSENFVGYTAIVGKEKHHDGLSVRIIALFKKPFTQNDSDISNTQIKKMIPMLKDGIPQLGNAEIKGGSSSTIESHKQNLGWELKWLGRKLDESTLPFKQTTKDGIKTRVFDKNIDNHELKWHRDERDRIVEVVKGSGWKFQTDNELPRTLKEGDRFTIPSEIYHRVIRGSGDLVIKIKEL